MINNTPLELLAVGSSSGIKFYYFVSYLFDYLPWLIAVAGSVALYRAFALRAVPWLAAHYVTRMFTFNIGLWLMHRAVPAPVDPLGNYEASVGNFVVVSTFMIEPILNALVVTLVLAQVAFLAAKSANGRKTGEIGILWYLYDNLNILGGCLLVLTILYPLPLVVLCLSTGK
jgi:hypothetical protein